LKADEQEDAGDRDDECAATLGSERTPTSATTIVATNSIAATVARGMRLIAR
jgi:hypothetical protein